MTKEKPITFAQRVRLDTIAEVKKELLPRKSDKYYVLSYQDFRKHIISKLDELLCQPNKKHLKKK